MMGRSLRTRLLGSYLVVIAAVVLAATVGVAVVLARHPVLYRQFDQRVEVAARLLRRRAALFSTGNGERLWKETRAVAEGMDVRALWLDREGAVVRDSAPEKPPPRLHLAANTRTVRYGHARAADGTMWAYAALSAPTGGWIVFTSPLPSRWALLLRLSKEWLRPLLEAGGLAVLLAVLLAWWLSRWIARPLHRLAAAADALAEGDFRPVSVEGPEEVRRLAQAFNAMAEQVEASQRSQRDFVANVSHELRTPLTSIQGFAQAIVDGTARDPERIRSSAEIIAEEAARMYRLVTALLDLARLDAGTVVMAEDRLDVGDLLAAVVARIQPQAEQRGVALHLEAPDGLVVYGDADRLMQVFVNLLDNALRHTPAGGEIWLTAQREGDAVVIAVRDTGEGIPPEALPRIFERFYRGDKARSGGKSAGLGLAIAREIVHAHGGTLTAISSPGEGSTFVVKLPCKSSA